ncbi:hypothetical protein, partial [Actinomadura sediminis]
MTVGTGLRFSIVGWGVVGLGAADGSISSSPAGTNVDVSDGERPSPAEPAPRPTQNVPNTMAPTRITAAIELYASTARRCPGTAPSVRLSAPSPASNPGKAAVRRFEGAFGRPRAGTPRRVPAGPVPPVRDGLGAPDATGVSGVARRPGASGVRAAAGIPNA